jgi:hypothetical protein
MPNAVVKAATTRSGKTPAEVETYWKDAQKAAQTAGLAPGSDRYYAYANSVVQRRTEGLRPYRALFTEGLSDRAVQDYLFRTVGGQESDYELESRVLPEFMSVSPGVREEDALSYLKDFRTNVANGFDA